MPYCRPEWPLELWQEFCQLSKKLGFKTKGKFSRWELQKKLMAYAAEHPELFSIPS